MHKPNKPFAFPGSHSFKQCNPSLSYDRPGRPPLPAVFEQKFCRSEQAAIINNILGKERYSFDAVVPEPYVYPAHVLETLLAMGPEDLEVRLGQHWASAGKLGRLGTLVKLFAWGIPVSKQELDVVVGDDSAFAALEDCGIVVQCEALPGVVSSSVQLFPVQHTSLIVATDWSLPYVASDAKTTTPVHAVDAHDIFVIQNIPRLPRKAGKVENVRVLNVASGSGVLGLAAADRGASAVLIDSNPRAAIFARFNSWLNLLTSRVEVFQRDLHAVFELFQAHDFFLLLSHPVGNNPMKVAETIQVALEATKAVLPADKGMSIISFEGQRCEDFTRQFNKNFCGEDVMGQTFDQAQGNHADLSGSVICRHPHGDKSDVMASEGMVFAWRGIPDIERDRPMDLDSCGHFDTIRMASFIGSGGVRACKFARPDMQCAPNDAFLDPAE
jgi:16S rRNA G966 N2-methylase RsmD